MPNVVSRLRSSVPWPSARSVATALLRPRTYGNLAYLALAFPLGLAYFVVLTVGLSVGVGLAVLGVGVVLVLAILVGTMGLVTAERRLAEALLGVEIDAPRWKVADREGLGDRVTGLVLDPAVWLGLVFLLSKLFVGTAAFALLVSLLTPTAVLIATPLYYRTPGVEVGVFLPVDVTRELSLYVPWNELLVGVSFVVRLTSWQVDSLGDALVMSVLGVVVLVLVVNLLNAAAWLCGRWARLLLGPALIERLGAG
jgi:Na+-transporting methylmalonyl-CoA/oxaloacetate decarboxylase gamma subunit